jgi:hypothetical protein
MEKLDRALLHLTTLTQHCCLNLESNHCLHCAAKARKHWHSHAANGKSRQILQLRDGFGVGIILDEHVSLAPCEDSDVYVAIGCISFASRFRAVVARSLLFHRVHVVIATTQSFGYGSPMLLEISVGG